jgi:hypothetical protein
MRESAFRFNTKSLHFLCLIVSENVSDLMEKRYPIYTYPWVPYDQNTTVHLRVPTTLRFGYFSTMSIIRGVVGYLLIFDTSNQMTFWQVLRWINYIITEKRTSHEYPNHYVILGYVFPNKKREVHQFEGEYFARLMGMTYIEIDSEIVTDLDKVWPRLITMFSVRADPSFSWF